METTDFWLLGGKESYGSSQGSLLGWVKFHNIFFSICSFLIMCEEMGSLVERSKLVNESGGRFLGLTENEAK